MSRTFIFPCAIGKTSRGAAALAERVLVDVEQAVGALLKLTDVVDAVPGHVDPVAIVCHIVPLPISAAEMTIATVADRGEIWQDAQDHQSIERDVVARIDYHKKLLAAIVAP